MILDGISSKQISKMLHLKQAIFRVGENSYAWWDGSYIGRGTTPKELEQNST